MLQNWSFKKKEQIKWIKNKKNVIMLKYISYYDKSVW